MLTLKQCNSAISNIKISGKALDAAVQDVGMSVLQHVEANREVSLACKLLAALPKGARKAALVAWFTNYGMISINRDKTTAKDRPFLFNAEGKTDLVEAAKVPWFKSAPEKPVVEMFDFQAQLTALLKRAADAQAKGQKIEGADLLTKIRSAAI
jgi:hypothetical protein